MSQLKNTAKIYNNKIFLGKDDSVLHQRKTNKRDFEILLKNSFFLNFVLSFFRHNEMNKQVKTGVDFYQPPVYSLQSDYS